MKEPSGDISNRADFSRVRYAQCWEDADVLLAGLDPQPGDRCLSIASAGDNTLALLARDPEQVIAIDLSAAQLACLELRVAAYRELDHEELLELMGSRISSRRKDLFRRCERQLTPETRDFWRANQSALEKGIGTAGRFENYFRIFRERILPLVHSRRRIEALLSLRSKSEREEFFERSWNSKRWRGIFRLFFSRFAMARLGRDKEFFRYVTEKDVAGRILERTRHALVELDPSRNPYLTWILTGTHRDALPFALREENFERIRNNLDRLEWRKQSLSEVLAEGETFDRYNLSDVFEYLDESLCLEIWRQISQSTRLGGRVAYWNMMVPRRGSSELTEHFHHLRELSADLFEKDQAFFYSDFIIEEVRHG
ncbi:MAG: DUF3419 family protein [Verrucomicrobiota bacterium]